MFRHGNLISESCKWIIRAAGAKRLLLIVYKLTCLFIWNAVQSEGAGFFVWSCGDFVFIMLASLTYKPAFFIKRKLDFLPLSFFLLLFAKSIFHSSSPSHFPFYLHLISFLCSSFKTIHLLIYFFLFRLCRTDGTARFVKEAPDTITSWVITAFSLDAFHGLGVIQQPTKVLLVLFIILLIAWNDV